MQGSWSYTYACAHLQHLLTSSALAAPDAGRLQERAQLVFRCFSPYLGQHLTEAPSLYFTAYLRQQLLAEVEVYGAPAAPNPATVYLRLLEGGQYVLQQEMAHGELAARLALYFAAARR
ncbi:hypothetical protein EJV47_25700 [Hymenobacter gummosus]|uniref:Uncharacterized protein n=1 Tax=Hymenobacter gummosus TaxID=1776032 RepID=A0A3S0IJ48_9BACT|nr:hypothetical protein [Hymenobacter gummosus]RTQ45276.1 hypothetical protein EJV47_25700 [Hymenobacter gummosus]